MYLYLSCLNTVKYMYWNTRFDFKQLDLQVLLFFIVRLLLVLCGHSFFSSPPQGPMTSDFEEFSYQILSITFLSHRNSWEKASISLFFNVECQTTTGTIFITSLVWCCPWLGIEPGTYCTRCQPSTTRLSRTLTFL